MADKGDGTASKTTKKKKTTAKKAATKKKTTAKKTTAKSKTAKTKTTKKKTAAAAAKETAAEAAAPAPKAAPKKAAKSAGGRVRVRQVRSTIGHPSALRRTLEALGIRHHQGEVVVTQNPAIMGMLNKVRHLVRVTPEE